MLKYPVRGLLADHPEEMLRSSYFWSGVQKATGREPDLFCEGSLEREEK